jgi:hypothetical protein
VSRLLELNGGRSSSCARRRRCYRARDGSPLLELGGAGLAEHSLCRASSSSTAALLSPLCLSAATYPDGQPLLALVGGGLVEPSLCRAFHRVCRQRELSLVDLTERGKNEWLESPTKG